MDDEAAEQEVNSFFRWRGCREDRSSRYGYCPLIADMNSPAARLDPTFRGECTAPYRRELTGAEAALISMADEPSSVGDVLDKIEELARKEGQVCLGHLVEALGSRSYGPFLLIPALIDISPVGGIPGLPTILGLIIAVVAAQMLFGRKHLWLPSFLAQRSISSERACRSTSKLRRLAAWLDRTFHGRLPKFTKGPIIRLAAGLCILLALTVPPLEILPFATTAPMAAIAAFGLALLVRDGLLMIIAIFLALGAVGLGIGLFGSKIIGGG